MRRLIARLALAVASTLTAVQAFAADPPAPPTLKGLWLLTEYPSQAVRPGEIANVRFKVQNAGLPPESLALTVSGAPSGWKADILGGGSAASTGEAKIGAAMRASRAIRRRI